MFKGLPNFDREYRPNLSDPELYYNGFSVSQEFNNLGIDVCIQVSEMIGIPSIVIFENKEDINFYRLSGKIKEEKDWIVFISRT